MLAPNQNPVKERQRTNRNAKWVAFEAVLASLYWIPTKPIKYFFFIFLFLFRKRLLRCLYDRSLSLWPSIPLSSNDRISSLRFTSISKGSFTLLQYVSFCWFCVCLGFEFRLRSIWFAEDSERKRKKKELNFLLRDALFSSFLNNQTWRGFWIARELVENLVGILIWTSLLILVVVAHVEEISATKWIAITFGFRLVLG